MKEVGYSLIFIGVITIVIGTIFLLAGKISWLGNLPGDIHLKGKNWTFSFPLVTCLLISILLSVLLNVIFRTFRH